MSQMMVCDFLLNDLLTRALATMNTPGDNASLRLWTACSPPANSSSPWTDFTEASYPGYSSVGIYLTWSPPARVLAGQYQSLNPTITFTPGGAGPYPIAGYVLASFANNHMFLVEQFDTPWQLTPGNPLKIQLQVNEWSRAILP